jgi:hypothetical protein
MRRTRSLTLLLSLLAVTGAACASGDDGGGGDDDRGDDDGDDDGGPGFIPEPVPESGVVYAAHYASDALTSLRIDRDPPEAGPSITLAAPTHDLILDPVHDLLVVVSDVAKTATIFQLDRPTSASDEIDAPVERGAITFDDTPLFAAIDPVRQRLYVVTMATSVGPPVTEMKVHPYDLTDPDAPGRLASEPWTIPVSTSFTLDVARRVLFLVGSTDDKLYGYDLVGDDGFEPLPGDPIDLTTLFPEDNATAFQARGLTVDVARNRLYAARSQGTLSELIALDYPADLPDEGARYGELAGLGDVTVVPDPFVVSDPIGERKDLWDAYVVGLDLVRGAVFASTDAYNGSIQTAMVTAFAPDLGSVGPGCEAVEGFGCWLREHTGGTPGDYLRTDGALCVDAEHQRVVASSLGAVEDDPGKLHVFGYDDDLAMTEILPAGGGDVAASALPISLVCH